MAVHQRHCLQPDSVLHEDHPPAPHRAGICSQRSSGLGHLLLHLLPPRRVHPDPGIKDPHMRPDQGVLGPGDFGEVPEPGTSLYCRLRVGDPDGLAHTHPADSPDVESEDAPPAKDEDCDTTRRRGCGHCCGKLSALFGCRVHPYL